MDLKVQTNIGTFFASFRSFCDDSKHILKSLNQIFHNLVEQSKDFCAVNEASLLETPLNGIPHVKDVLMSKIIERINKTTNRIMFYSDKLEQWHKKLSSKFSTLETNVKMLDFSDDSALMKGSALQPRLALLMEFALDAVNYALYISSKVGVLMSTLHIDFANWRDLAETDLKIDNNWRERIDHILLLTQYCGQ